MTRSLRRSFGALGLLAGILLYAFLVAWFAAPLTRLPALVQLPLWLVLGTGWVLPLRPLIVWIETGHWSRRR